MLLGHPWTRHKRPEALWTANVPGATCLNRATLYYVQLAFNISMDFLVLVVPLFILRHLSLPWIQRLIILIVLSFGAMYVHRIPSSPRLFTLPG